MRVSQVLHSMDKDEIVCIIDSARPVDNDVIYSGPVRGVHRDSLLNSLGVDMLFVIDDVFYIDVVNRLSVKRGRKRERRIAKFD